MAHVMYFFLIHVLPSIPPTIAALAALIVAIRNDRKITEIHIGLNGRLSQLLEASKIAAHAEGRQQERNEIAKGLVPIVNAIGQVKKTDHTA